MSILEYEVNNDDQRCCTCVDDMDHSSNISSLVGRDEEISAESTLSLLVSQNEFAMSIPSTILPFLPDFTEHPKPVIVRHHNTDKNRDPEPKVMDPIPPEDEDEITFLHDFVAGGVAGSASVVVGHPFDTIKVRLQTSKSINSGIMTALGSEFGGVTSLFRGITAPLYTAAIVNAIVFGSYGFSSRVYNAYFPTYNEDIDENIPTHDPWHKAMICGAFAGLMQCFVICPMEHVKCRLQTQQPGMGSKYKSPFQTTKSILKEHGIRRLFQGWWTTTWREVPAFGIYFAVYDYLKDRANDYIANNMDVIYHRDNSNASSYDKKNNSDHSHTWLASAFAGGSAGCVTWALVYPIDVIKTRIQTSPLNTPWHELKLYHVGKSIVQRHGIRYLFRGLGVTLIRAFPVNGTIFPVYEFTLKQVCKFTESR